MISASTTTPLSLATPSSPRDLTQQPSTSVSSLDDVEQHILTLLSSASLLLAALSTVTADQADHAKPHALTFLSTLQQLRQSLTAATSAASVGGAVEDERLQRRSAYLDQLMFQLECDMTAHISELLESTEKFGLRCRNRARQRLTAATLR